MNELGKSLQEWWDSDACKQLQKESEEAKQRAIGKYFMLSESDKLDMVHAICYIMCKAESEGTSHRGLQDALGVYPAGFWIDHLMDVHNALCLIITIRRGRRICKMILMHLTTSLSNVTQSRRKY
jgi:hypothetical protein